MKKNIWKRIASLALALVLVMGLMPHVTEAAAAVSSSITHNGYTLTVTEYRVENGHDCLNNIDVFYVSSFSRDANKCKFSVRLGNDRYTYMAQGVTATYDLSFDEISCGEALRTSVTVEKEFIPDWNFIITIQITRAPKAHTGGGATCMTKGNCDVCGEPYFGDHGWKQWSSNGNGTHTRTCAYNSNHTETKTCSGGTPTCTTPAICTFCQGGHGPIDRNAHSWGQWSNNNNNHTRTCSNGCGATESGNCTGGTATCIAPATCIVCNLPYGDKDTDNHSWSRYSYENNLHTRTCSNCGEVEETVEHKWGPWEYAGDVFHKHTCQLCGESERKTHTGGTSTCTTYRICEICYGEYGYLRKNAHDWGVWTSNGDGTHSRICNYNSSHTETEACSGGTATCINLATCDVCKSLYGDVDPDGHAWGPSVRDSDRLTHTHICTLDPTHVGTEACSSTSETCTGTNLCDGCGGECPSEINTHSWGDWLYSAGQHHRTCNNNSEHTESENCAMGEDGRCPVCKTAFVASVTAGETTMYYKTFGEAITAASAQKDSKVKLLSNISLGSGYQDIRAGVFTIDLNGKELSSTGNGDSVLYLNGSDINVTVVDEAGGGKISGKPSCVHVEYSTLNLNGVTLVGSKYGVHAGFRSTVRITGGSISGGTWDLFCYSHDVRLQLGADGIGTTFPGGICASMSLNGMLDSDASYWAVVDGKDTMLTVANNVFQITDKGDITVKAGCNHPADKQTCADNGDGTHSFKCSVCHTEELETHRRINTISDEGATSTITCDLCKAVLATETVVAPAHKTYGDGESEKITFVYSGENIGDPDYEVYFQWVNDRWAQLEEAPVNAGSYKAQATWDNAGVEEFSLYVEYEIAKADPGIGAVTAGVVNDTLETSAIVLTRENTDVNGNLTVDAGQTLAWGDNTIRYTFTPNDTTNYKVVKGKVAVTVVDTIAPTGTVTVSTNSWAEFLNNITFGLFFKETQTVSVTAEDNLSGVAKIEYIESATPMNMDAVKAATQWTEMESGSVSVTLEDTKQFVYYIRITDKAGNVTFLSSDGAEYDTAAPVIEGVDNGATYYTTQAVTVTDKNIDTITLNGEAVTGSISLAGNKEATYTIVATDKAGNSTTVTVKMAPIADNVTPDNKSDLEQAKADLEKALEDNSGNYTEEEKQAIQDEIDHIDDALKVIENVEAVEDVISDLPATVEPDDEETVEKIEDAKKAYDELTEYEKSLVDDDTKKKLDDLTAAAVAYKIVKGDNGKWTKGSTSGLSFTANGPLGKFSGIEIDGKVIDAKHYDAVTGSTVITLKASYLETLSVGTHTITVVYTDGEAEGTFQINPKSVTPATGDNFNILLWTSVMIVSLAAIAVLLIEQKKRRYVK